MKKGTILILVAIAGLGLFLYYRNKNLSYNKAILKAGDIVKGIYIGSQRMLGTNQYLSKNDEIKGILNSDGSVKYSYVTSYGTKTINIPASQVKNLTIN